jgi:cytochrome d ubiquinol oxidase subunit II
VYGLLLPILYMPLMLMLIALVFRGVSFEFRFKADSSKPVWNWLFAISSITAAFFQGVILGCYIQGFSIAPTSQTINDPNWLSPFSLLTGIALVCGYALLGATWMLIKSSGDLQKKLAEYAKGLIVIVGFFLLFVSIWTPLQSEALFSRWFGFPNILFLAPLPLITALMLYLTWKNLSLKHERRPFIYSIIVFLCAYAGIAISVYPYLVPSQLTIWQGAAPESTLSFILIGELITLPILLVYTAFAYHVFRGKSFAAYHH